MIYTQSPSFVNANPSFGATISTPRGRLILRDCIVDAGHNSFAFFNNEEPIDTGQVDVFDKTARPANLDSIDARRWSQPKMKALVIG